MFVGLDIGTTATKAILIDERQVVWARAETAYPTNRPGPGLSEQDPATWIEAAATVLDGLRAAAPGGLAAVRGIGLSGQMHSLVLLGANDAPLAPAMLWNDARGVEECRLLEEAVPDIGRLTGVIPMPSFTAAKLLWTRRHAPDRFAAIHYVLLPKDYVRLWLTGERAVDMSDAAGAQLLDGARRRWAQPVVEAIGLPPACLPPLREGSDVGGILRPEIAGRFGLPNGVTVAMGGGDAATGAIGLGCIRAGAAFLSVGTGAVAVVAQDRFAPLPETVLHDFAHATPGLWYQMAAMLNGASCLAWAARLVGEPHIEALLARVEARYLGPSPVLFLPYLSGERTPHNDLSLRAGFFGLDMASDAVDLAQAVLEGVAFAIADGFHALSQAGLDPPEIGFTGGGARSRLWGRLIATVTARRLLRYESADLGPALGAARLGMVAAGSSLADAAPPPRVLDSFDPDPARRDHYADRHRQFKELTRHVMMANPGRRSRTISAPTAVLR